MGLWVSHLPKLRPPSQASALSMRLLTFDGASGSILSKTFYGDILPPYAILSHTWGEDTDEFDFRDLIGGTGKDKPGYRKVLFCGERARIDELKYFWVDTCCIDKSNSVELQEAINSMFCWYQDATRCYIYLEDVSSCRLDIDDENAPIQLQCEAHFRDSKWFTRGWTLQELLAPHSVEFYSKEHIKLGNKRSLERQIHETTGIAIKALRGCPLSIFSIEERFGWALSRQTTRPEDWAYSLLGIFDVFMPLIYGEGRDRAILRLRVEVGKLQSSKNARCFFFLAEVAINQNTRIVRVRKTAIH